MKKILVIQPIRSEALRLFKERSDIRYEVIEDFSPSNLLEHIGDADAITIRDAPITSQILESAPKLRVISRHGVGYDNIPIDYCTARKLPVTTVGDVNATSVAEQTIFLMLAAARRGVELDDAVRRGDFAARSRLLGIELKGRIILIVGFGRIGREVAKRAAAFGMQVIVFDPYADRNAHAGHSFIDTIEDGLAIANVVSLHVPLGNGTRDLIGRREFALLPVGAIIINTARGGILDEAALLEAIRSGHVRAAGLDTYLCEPLPIDHPLIQERRAILSPHSAALTEESLIAMGMATARNALAGLDGTLDPDLVVNRSVLTEKLHAL